MDRYINDNDVLRFFTESFLPKYECIDIDIAKDGDIDSIEKGIGSRTIRIYDSCNNYKIMDIILHVDPTHGRINEVSVITKNDTEISFSLLQLVHEYFVGNIYIDLEQNFHIEFKNNEAYLKFQKYFSDNYVGIFKFENTPLNVYFKDGKEVE